MIMKVWLVKMLELPDCNFSTVLKVFPSEEAAKAYVESVKDEFWGNLCITEHTVEEDGFMPGAEEARKLVVSLHELFELGADEITQKISTTMDWEFEVTVKVVRWGAL